MPPQEPRRNDNTRLRILSIGGNAVSAFISWRLQATNACDITLVWKSGFESVAQYGISFRSSLFGNERFKPRSVVRTPEEAASSQRVPFDYVLLCIKALPEVYDIASVLEPVVTPQHTCILLNTSNSIGIEALIEKRFPKNVVLSIVSAADLHQSGIAEFEHSGSTELWVGPANLNSEIPPSIQGDMSEALAMTLNSGQVDCKVSKNILQQQVEKMAGPIAFHTTSVLFETPNHAELLELPGVRDLITEALDEILTIAKQRQCTFSADFKEKTMEEMIAPMETNSTMYQDYAARRPMEVENYLGSPVKLAKESDIKVPRISTLYAMLNHVNQANLKRTDPATAPAALAAPPPPIHRAVSGPPNGRPMNGHMPGPPPGRGGRGGRAPSMSAVPPPMRRPGPPNGYPPRGPPRQNFDHGSHPLDDFSYLAAFDGEAYGDGASTYGDGNMSMRERELVIRQKELALRERELAMQERGGPRASRHPMPPPSQLGDFDEDEGEDYFDAMAYRGPPVDPDNIDMMSVTSRRTRKTPSASQLRTNPEGNMGNMPPRRGGPGGMMMPGRPQMRNRNSSRMGDQPNLADIRASLMDDPLLGTSSNRYGAYDSVNMGRDSRAASLTSARLNELQQGSGYGPFPAAGMRRTSQSPAMPMSPNGRQGHPGFPSPDMRSPGPRYSNVRGPANNIPHEYDERGPSNSLYPPKHPHAQIRSLNGSASASAGSGDSGRSHHIDSENSAYSSQSSLGPRPPIGVR